eukprot:TRINITY_DN35594_c0_g1_i1.p1 TRINITY_DN35594_c0_g1~~TRINITY_DN35594_c0_g1_i1.p1  ORF type:complete len:212 (-),score=28.30 TRINITY_DN35594_c0_g1_i1:1233-1868(-)
MVAVEIHHELSDDAISSQTESPNGTVVQNAGFAVKETSARLRVVWEKCWADIMIIMKEGSIWQKFGAGSALAFGSIVLGGISSFILLTVFTVIVASLLTAFLSLWAVTAVLALLLGTVGAIALAAITVGGAVITTVTCCLLAVAFWATGVAFTTWVVWKCTMLALELARSGVSSILGPLQGTKSIETFPIISKGDVANEGVINSCNKDHDL